MAMHNHFFRFKQFTIHQEHCAMKVSTDGVLLGAWTQPDNATSILDIGTGTGLIAIMLAQRTTASIVGVEIEPNAYRQAEENAANSPWKQQITMVQSSFQDYFRHSNLKFDLIVSNPPFFSNSLKAPHDGRNLARHNDELPTEELLIGVDKMLSPDGRFCLILPYVDSSLFLVDAALHDLYCVHKTYIKPKPKKNRTRVLLELARERQKVHESDLIIQDEEGKYTEDFVKLTRDYYLFL